MRSSNLIQRVLFVDSFVTAFATEKYSAKLNIYGLLMLSTSYQTLPILLITCVILVTRRSTN